MEKVQVNIISGFLGAGKTTAIINLLKNKHCDENWAVIINEFGKVSIDSQTLRSSSASEKIFDIPGGCICCTAKGYFNANLDKIIKSGQYSRIIIEPSGLGGIDMVSELVLAKPVLFLNPVICLVDIMGIELTRLQINPVYQMQIKRSDVVVFTKTDLIMDESKKNSLIQRFQAMFPQTKIYGKSIVDSTTLNLELPPAQDKALINKLSLYDPKLSATNYLQKYWIFEPEIIFDENKIKRYLNQHQSIIRAKGYLRTESGWQLMNYTLTGCFFECLEARHQSEIVLITDGADQNFIDRLYEDFKINRL